MTRLRVLVSLLFLAALCMADPNFGAAAQDEGSGFSFSPRLVAAGDGQRLELSVEIPDKHYLYVDHTKVEPITDATLEPQGGLDIVEKLDPNHGGMVKTYPHSGTLVYTVTPAVTSLTFKVSYWGCDDRVCFLPETQELVVDATGAVVQTNGMAGASPAVGSELPDGFSFVGRGGGYLERDAFLEFLDGIESGRGGGQDMVQRIMSRYGVVIGVLALLGFGFLLNLTPCVLPMIPVNIAIIGAGAQAGSRTRGLLLGAAYGLGMALTYGVLGVVVATTGAQFGSLNSSPWFNAVIALIFIGLSLGMFGVYEMDFSRFQRAGAPAQERTRGPVLTALLMGGVAALLAGACVAPVLLSVLVMATGLAQQGNPAGLLLPFVLGLGMALPWPIVGAGFSILPKPGNWMVRVRAAFGVIILAAALYYGFVAARIWQSRGATDTGPAEASDNFWLHDLDAAFATAARENKPIFADVWATWCKNCHRMEKTTFKDPAVVSRLEPYVRVKVQAEDLNAAETKALLRMLGVEGGLPHYVVISPPGS